MCQANTEDNSDAVSRKSALHPGDGEDALKRVVIHRDEFGEISVFFDEGITVFAIDDNAPSDRIYRMDRYPIKEDMLIGDIGHNNDGSAANARAYAIAAELTGQPHLSLVEADA